MLVVCLAGVFCLAPFALYLLWLAVLNRREHPTVVAGSWDFATLLAGLSGFLLFGGGLFLSLLQSNMRFWMRGNFEALREAWGQEQLSWGLTAAGYLIVVAGGSALILAARRRSLVVYHVEPEQLEIALVEIFEQIDRPIERRGNLWLGKVPLFEFEPFAAGRTVTLRWVGEDIRLFQEVDRRLREAVTSIHSGENDQARWLFTSAVGCLVFVVFCLLLVGYALAIVR